MSHRNVRRQQIRLRQSERDRLVSKVAWHTACATSPKLSGKKHDHAAPFSVTRRASSLGPENRSDARIGGETRGLDAGDGADLVIIPGIAGNAD
jgi:hypothetical protein